MHHVQKDDCMVSPVCEYHLQPSFFKSDPQVGKFKIQIPHIVKNLEKVKPHIKVRYGNLHCGSLVKVKDVDLHNHHTDEIQYDIEDKYMTISPSHFTGFIVTAEGINCCAQSASVMFFGSLRNLPGKNPLATVKVCFSSMHSFIKDYESVSINMLLKEKLQYSETTLRKLL